MLVRTNAASAGASAFALSSRLETAGRASSARVPRLSLDDDAYLPADATAVPLLTVRLGGALKPPGDFSAKSLSPIRNR